MKYISWNEYYDIAVELYKTTGNINVPARFTYKGYKIGNWLSVQRGIQRKSGLKPERAILLEKIGIEWNRKDSRKNDAFMHKYNLLKEYKKSYGDCLVPQNYVVDDVYLGKWVAELRLTLRGKGKRSLTNEQCVLLENIGFECNEYFEKQKALWDEYFSLISQFATENGLVQITENTVYHGLPIGKWVHRQRVSYKAGRLQNDRYQKLCKLGFEFTPNAKRWEIAFGYAESYFLEFQNLDIPNDYVVDGFNLGAWISNQRQIYNQSRTDMNLSEEQIKRLNSIGMHWKAPGAGSTSFAEQALFYYLLPFFPDVSNRDSSNGFEVDIYIPSIKTAIEYDGAYWHRNKIKQDNAKDTKCHRAGIQLIRIREQPLPDTKYAVCYHRSNIGDNKSLEDILRLILKEVFSISSDINISRDTLEITKKFQRFSTKSWYSFFREAEFYYKQHGDLLVPAQYVSEKSIRLGSWIQNQRQAYKGQNEEHLSKEEIALLESIGMVWDVREYEWNRIYSVACEYYNEVGNLCVPRNCIYHNVNLGRWINTQRNVHNGKTNHSMSLKRKERLEAISMVWNTKANE